MELEVDFSKPTESQVDLVHVQKYPNGSVHYLDFTIHGGSAFWTYYPLAGLVKGEDYSQWEVHRWLLEYVHYPTYARTAGERRRERIAQFNADLDTQR